MMERVLIYSHDTYGLGHLRRCMRIAAAMVESQSVGHVLIASGSPQATSFHLPAGVDIMKMPAVTKDQSGGYRSRTLGLSLDEVAGVRARLVVAAAESFRPDAILVDHAPVGMHGEIVPLLDALDRMRPRPIVVLGMREIVDSVDLVERQWSSGGVWERLMHSYHGVVVYGDAAVKTTASELNLAGRLAIPVEHVGYVAPPGADLVGRHRRMPSVVVTPGGGGDGLPVLEAYADFIHTSPLATQVRSIIVTGPFADGGPLADLVERVTAFDAPVEIVRFSAQLEGMIATADGAVTMAGYNTVAEMLAHRVPALLVPRRVPRVEQWLRATRLSAVASFMPVSADEITRSHLEAFVEGVLARRPARDHQLDLGGARATGFALNRIAGRMVTASTSKEIA